MTTHFFGDAERDFNLTGELILELERKAMSGIGALSKRVMSGDFGFNDIIEILRLGMIGGGTSPKDAAELVAAYADKTPIAELYPIALAVIEQRFFGTVTTMDEHHD